MITDSEKIYQNPNRPQTYGTEKQLMQFQNLF